MFTLRSAELTDSSAEMKTSIGRSTAPAIRVDATNPTNVHRWDDTVEGVVVPGIRSGDMYGVGGAHVPPEFA